MATRVIERPLQECVGVIRECFVEAGFALKEEWDGDRSWGARGLLKRREFMCPVECKAQASEVSETACRIAVDVVPRWSDALATNGLWALVALAPLFGLTIGRPWLAGSGLLGSRLAWGVAVGACMAWLSVVALPGILREQRQREWMQQAAASVWAGLVTGGRQSHALTSLGEGERGFAETWAKLLWVAGALCLALLALGLVMSAGMWVAGMDARAWFRTGIWVDMVRLPCVMGGAGGAVVSFLAWAFFEWAALSAKLPHRYQWRLRLGLGYFWWAIACTAPGMLLVAAITGGVAQWVGAEELRGPLVVGGFVAALALQVTAGLVAFREMDRMKGGVPGPWFGVPSTKYEEVSSSSDEGETTELARAYQRLTLVVFVTATTTFWVSALFAFLMLVTGVGALLGIAASGESPGWWPVVIPSGLTGEAVQAMVLTALVSWPTALAGVGAGRSARRVLRRRRSVGDCFDEVLARVPPRPLEALRRELAGGSLRVICLPLPTMGVGVDQLGLWGKDYALTICEGALTNLSAHELEALLWHECGHGQLLRRRWYRNLLVLLSPWGARFADLAEDLYKEERRADAYAAEQLGNVEALCSALAKIGNAEETRRRGVPVAPRRRWVEEWWELVWRLDWVASIHPSPEQRQEWLVESHAGKKGCTLSADGAATRDGQDK